MSILTRANRVNLDKLATLLESLPENYEHFEMASFAGLDEEDEKLIDYALNNGGLYEKCGTVGCAVGHGPAAGVYARKGVDVVTDPDDGSKMMDWDTYSKRFVCDIDSSLWTFLFGGYWNHVDNTHRGAAARIRYVLKHGKTPAVFTGSFDYHGFKNSMPAYKEFRK